MALFYRDTDWDWEKESKVSWSYIECVRTLQCLFKIILFDRSFCGNAACSFLMKPHPNFFTLGRDCVVLIKCPFEMTLQQRAVFAVYSKLNYVEHVAYPNDTKLDFRSVLWGDTEIQTDRFVSLLFDGAAMLWFAVLKLYDMCWPDLQIPPDPNLIDHNVMPDRCIVHYIWY